jgi:hypothetical protein
MSQPIKEAASAGAQPAAGDETAARGYRAGLEKAMALVWQEKSRHSVVTEAYFALKKVWDELYLESTRTDEAGKK